MNEDKKTRPDVAASRRAEVEAETRQDTASTNDSTTTPRNRQMAISDYLSTGQHNAVPLRHLKELVHLPGREVRKLIQSERLHGTPILSDNKSGYFLPADDLEREKFVRSMRGRAAEIEAVADAVEKAVLTDG